MVGESVCDPCLTYTASLPAFTLTSIGYSGRPRRHETYLPFGLGFGRVSCKANAAALLAAFDELGFLSTLPPLDEVLAVGRSGFLDMIFISMVG